MLLQDVTSEIKFKKKKKSYELFLKVSGAKTPFVCAYCIHTQFYENYISIFKN